MNRTEGVAGDVKAVARHRRGISVVFKTLFALALSVWAAVAVLAAAAPNRLPDPALPWLDVRRDTLGFAAFVVAGAAHVASLISTGDVRDQRRLLACLLRTTRLFGSIVVAYIVLMGLSHPHTLTLQLTHLMPFPTELMAGVSGAAAAVTSHLVLRRRRARSRRAVPLVVAEAVEEPAEDTAPAR